MVRCPACGQDTSGRFCPSCGNRLGDDSGKRRTSTPAGELGRDSSSKDLRGSTGSSNAGRRASPTPEQRRASVGASDMGAVGSKVDLRELRDSGNQGKGRKDSSRRQRSPNPITPDEPRATSPKPRQPGQKADPEVAEMLRSNHERNTRERDMLISNSQAAQSRVTVAVRKRPLVGSEAMGGGDVVSARSLNTLALLEAKKSLEGSRFVEKHKFTFDEVFDDDDDNREVYKRTASMLIDLVFDGGYCTCFAYGQTGSGKTFTMLGGQKDGQRGLYLQAADDIFAKVESNLCVAISFYEIYAGKLYDLLNNREQVFARADEDDRVHVRGLTEHFCASTEKMMNLVLRGLGGRASSSTTMNDESSRSHAVLDIKLKLQRSKKEIGRLSVIDLAGSERASVGHAGDRQVQMEGAEINKSLLALKECIRALEQGQRHVPFRQSELTQILKDSFVGDKGHTVMIANVSPAYESCPETLNTLRYAYRVKELKTEDDEGSSAQSPASRGSRAGNRIRNAKGEIMATETERPKCPGCGAEKRNVAALEAHKEECGLLVIACDYCPASFKRKDQEKHSQGCAKFPVECKQCNESVPREALKRHQAQECPKGETSCLFCRAKLTRDELEAHKKVCEQRTIECEDCGAKVKFSQLAKHKTSCKKVNQRAQARAQVERGRAESPGASPVESDPPRPTPTEPTAPSRPSPSSEEPIQRAPPAQPP
eukprot:Hpha_TRINITY_DN15939_c1_g5::TRINITY_DN15939_c1_g5_i1::g.71703::m.71703/K10393/KIF2_24, MCAK; kinesin family member 2/24